MKRIVVENLRSAYNVGNILRTADALGWGVVFAWYTARPDHKQVKKTALWAELTVPTLLFDDLESAYVHCTTTGLLIVAELTPTSIPLQTLQEELLTCTYEHIYVVVGNEVTGVETSTLSCANYVTHIPMLGSKESLNVGQAAAIIMRAFRDLSA